MADETTLATQQPDAIRVPRTGGGFAVLSELDAVYASLLGASKVYVFNQGTERFIVPRPGDQLYFPSDSPNSGQSRYRWEDHRDGVFFGYLIPESDLPAPDTAATNILLKLRTLQAQREAAARAGGAAAPGGSAGA